MSDDAEPVGAIVQKAHDVAVFERRQSEGTEYWAFHNGRVSAYAAVLEWIAARQPAPATADEVAALAEALAVVFSYHELNARMDSRGASTFNGEGSSYWRDRAEAVIDAKENR